MKYKEVEFKYRADEISLTAFTEFCKNRGNSTFINPSGYDYFFEHSKHPDRWARHRVGPAFNQLTFKRKTTDKNNFVRTEHNIDLGPKVVPDQTKALLSEFGYAYSSSIFKNVFIYEFDRYTFVYYICYDEDLAELGRFIEIEMAEDYPWESEESAWNALVQLEYEAKALGLSPQRRMKNSLFEMFKKS